VLSGEATNTTQWPKKKYKMLTNMLRIREMTLSAIFSILVSGTMDFRGFYAKSDQPKDLEWYLLPLHQALNSKK
jgi:hypothetical protein